MYIIMSSSRRLKVVGSLCVNTAPRNVTGTSCRPVFFTWWGNKTCLHCNVDTRHNCSGNRTTGIYSPDPLHHELRLPPRSLRRLFGNVGDNDDLGWESERVRRVWWRPQPPPWHWTGNRQPGPSLDWGALASLQWGESELMNQLNIILCPGVWQRQLDPRHERPEGSPLW